MLLRHNARWRRKTDIYDYIGITLIYYVQDIDSGIGKSKFKFWRVVANLRNMR